MKQNLEDARGGWTEPAVTPHLAAIDVHVWMAELPSNPGDVSSLGDVLSQDERNLAERFKFEKLRARYIVGRATLRILLGRYLGRNPAGIRFRYGPKGKPALDDDAESAGLQFNLSHAGDLVLFGFAREIRVGIDVELIDRRVEDLWGVAKRFFSPCEYEALCALPPEQQRLGFFNCWTRKEAYIKAVGEGLSLPLNRFDVTLAPGDPPRLLSAQDDPQGPERWSILDLAPAEGYVGALAAETRDVNLFRWKF